MPLFRSLFVAAALALSVPASGYAGDNPVVVELYTSQGCSSCPPADAILHELAKRNDVIPLAFHVDYWDYIGWKDLFADPAHAKRQRAYAAQGNRRSIYTPEIIVNGETDIVGAKPMVLSKAITDHAERTPVVGVELTRNGDTLTVQASVLETGVGPMIIQMLRYTPEKITKIKRGENAGKTLRYTNVVEGLTVLGAWDGVSPLSMTAKIDGDKPVVVLIQNHNAGPILAAGVLR